MLEVENLTKIYKSEFWRRPLGGITNLSFSVKEGSVAGFIGANGAGKSTTLKILAGLIRPNSGRAFINGKSPEAAQTRAHVGYMPELPYLMDYLSGKEFLQYCGRLYNLDSKKIETGIQRVTHLLALQPEWLSKKIKTYSKGMVQRLGLAQALLHQPKILLLDEPLSGLDPLGRRQLRDVLLQLKREGITLFYSTHVLSDLELVCDDVVVLNQGKLLYAGAVKDWVKPLGYQITLKQSLPPELLTHSLPLSEVTTSVVGQHFQYTCRSDSVKQNLIALAVDQKCEIIECLILKPDFETALTQKVTETPYAPQSVVEDANNPPLLKSAPQVHTHKESP